MMGKRTKRQECVSCWKLMKERERACTVSTEGARKCEWVGDVIRRHLLLNQSHHWAICHLRKKKMEEKRNRRESVTNTRDICICHMFVRDSSNLVMRQRVQTLPVALDLRGDVFVLKDDSGESSLSPFWWNKTRSQGTLIDRKLISMVIHTKEWI